MLTVIVADDEKIARKRLVRLIEETGDAEVVAACAGGRETVEQVIALQPQILFLDVQMPDLDGFAVLRELDGKAAPATVFVTAFDQYAVRAFDVHAVDYLLKPFDTTRFREAFGRAKERASRRGGSSVEDERMRALLSDYVAHAQQSANRQHLDRVAVKVDGVLKIVRTADVDWWETDGNYIRLHVGGTSHLIRMTAQSIEPQLDPRSFIRIHRRYIVNVDRIVEVQPWFAGDAIIVLRNGAKLRLSRTYRERLHTRLGARAEAAEGVPTRRWALRLAQGFGVAGGAGAIRNVNGCSTSCRTFIVPIFAAEKRMYGSASRTALMKPSFTTFKTSNDVVSANPVVSTMKRTFTVPSMCF
jgi:two-component system LytT family response regulator